jgi:hypothetical protein
VQSVNTPNQRTPACQCTEWSSLEAEEEKETAYLSRVRNNEVC